MDANWFITQGALGVVLLVLGIAIWRMTLWAKAKVVEPVVDSHLELIANLNEHVPKTTIALEAMTKATNDRADVDRKHTELLNQIVLNQGQLIKGFIDPKFKTPEDGAP